MITPRPAFGMGRLASAQRGGVLFLSGLGAFIAHSMSRFRLSLVAARLRLARVPDE